MLVLASTSATRTALLSAAGVAHEAVAPGLDETAAKAALGDLSGRALADALAELKAIKMSNRRPGALVLGCDQTLERDDGVLLDKPGVALVAQLSALAGRSHKLHAAAVVAIDGVPVWRCIETVTLHMRALSDAFIADYAAREGESVAHCVGGYRIEGAGVQLFDRIEGSHFAILGLPLLPLLSWLRLRGVLAS